MAEGKIRTLGPGSLTIGPTSGGSGTAQNFAADCTNVTLTPDTSTDDAINFLDGTSEAGAQTTTWTLGGTIKENFSNTSLQTWCMDNAGKTFPFVFVPSTEGDLELGGNVTIAPIAFGGDVKSKNDQDFSFAATDVRHSAKSA